MCQVRARGGLSCFPLPGKQKNHAEFPQRFCPGVSSARVSHPTIPGCKMSHSLFGWVFLHIQSALGPSRVRKCLTASNRDPLKPKERVWVLFLRIQEVNSQKSGQEVCEGPAQAPVVNVPEIRPSNPWSKSEVLTCHGIYLVFPPLKWEERWQWSFLAKTLASLSTFQKTLEY